MKIIKNISILVAWLLIVCIATGLTYGGQFKPFVIVFTGRWQPAEDPLMIDDGGFQDIQNMRRDGRSVKGVAGDTRISTAVVNATYDNIKNGFHFVKHQPSESHVLVYAQDSLNTASRVYQNETAIPSVGDFNGTALLTNAKSTAIGRFSMAPQGNVLYCDESATYIWGGDNLRTSAFIVSSSSIIYTATSARDYSDEVQNTSDESDQVAIITATNNDWIVGSTRPLQGLTYTVSSANAAGATLSCKEWTGTNWSAVGALTDNTSGLTQTGSVSWTSTASTSKPKYLEGLILYWYQFNLDQGSAKISYVTVDAPWQMVKNLWDGVGIPVASALVLTGPSGYSDYTDEAQDDDPTTAINLSAISSACAIYLGFTEPVQGIEVKISGDNKNTNPNTLSIHTHNGDKFQVVSSYYDSTKDNDKTFAKSGTVIFERATTEFKTAIYNVLPLYYYKITINNSFSQDTKAYHVTGIPIPGKVSAYKFPAMFQNRAFLFSETNKDKNKAVYSVENAPDVWNGEDSGELYFGDEKELTAAVVIYNLYRTSGIYQMIVTKANETYRVFGDNPNNWEVQKMSSNIGCVAPLSMAICEISDIASDEKRHVAIWQSDTGIVMTDGAVIQPISYDIRNYWDPDHADYIPADNQKESVGVYDPNLHSYKLLLNDNGIWKELEYSLKYNQWTKIVREESSSAMPFEAIFQVHDTDGNTLVYGACSTGYVYRTENGTTWNGTAISQYLQTKDLVLDDEQDLFRHTIIEKFRLFMKDKDGTSLSYLLKEDGDYILQESGDKIITANNEDISIQHYGRDVLTTTGVSNQYVPTTIDMSNGPYDTQSCYLGPFLIHSFKLSSDITTLAGGMELNAIALYYDALNTIIDD